MAADVDYNNMAWWYPRIKAAGLPTPLTRMVHTDLPLMAMLDGPSAEDSLGHRAFSDFLIELLAAADRVRYLDTPFFLRTGHTSGKHSWDQCCYVCSSSSLGDHVYNLVEESAMADLLGLPVQDWAVRALLPTAPVLVLPAYGNMPVVREFRYFVDWGNTGVLHAEVTHVQPYWPKDALVQGLEHRTTTQVLGLGPAEAVGKYMPGLDRLPTATHQKLSALAKAACKAVGGGYWSVDLLEDKDGVWYVTDMAEGARSYKYSPPGWDIG